MAITYEWIFEPECADENGLTDVVKFVNWHLWAHNGVVSTPERGRVALDPPNQNAFVALENIPEAAVRGWVLAKEGKNEAQMKAAVAKRLAEVKAPTIKRKAFSF